MSKRMTNLFLTLTGIFGLTQAFATDIYPFFLQRQDGTVLEGYFSPPSTSETPIVFAIQGSSCESILGWHKSLSDQADALGLGVITLEKQGISRGGNDLLAYSQTSCLQNRLEDYVVCLENAQLICPGWEGKLIFWGESEGGMLAANLASQTPQTAAVLLFGTDGGMKPKEEVNYFPQSYLEEQTDRGYLEASVVMPLSEQSLPVYLVHGVEDNQIPIEGVDLIAEALAKTNSLTYLRLEGYGHALVTAEVQDSAFQWLDSVLSQQEVLVDRHVQVGEGRLLSKETQKGSSDYILCRDSEDRESGMQGSGDVSTGAGYEKDSDGNEHVWGDVRYSRDFGNGVRVQGEASGGFSKDKDGNVRGEGKVEGRVGFGF